MIAAVTGHRPNKLGGYRTPNPTFNSVMEGLDRALLELQPERVIVGMAQGVDQWMAELCIYNGIPFVAAIPFPDFDSRWPEHGRVKYRQLLSRAADIVMVCDGDYEAWKMQRRNEWMVDNCQVLIAVFDGTYGGTANCVRYAEERQCRIHRVRYQQPSPIVHRERPPLTVAAQPAQPVRIEDLFGPPARVERPRPRPQTTEGQRAAQRRAQIEMEREERRIQEELRLEGARAQARARREEARPRIQITDVSTPEEPREKVEVVRDFSRFVDLDV